MYMYFTVTKDTQHIVGVELISPYQADWTTYKELVIPGTPDSESEEILLEWERYRDNKVQIAEAPFMIKSGGKYYLTYSVNGAFNKYYNVCYAVSDTPMGNFVKPYEEGKLWTNLLMGFPGTDDEEALIYNQWNGYASGTGHHCFFYSGDELLIGYHAHQNRNWNSKYYTERYFAFDYVYFDESGTPFINGPTYSVINLPASVSGYHNVASGGKITTENVVNAENILDNYIVDCYNLDKKENEVILGEGKSYIEITFDASYEIGGIIVYINTCDGRLRALEGLLRDHDRVIIFYNLDAELEALRAFLDASRVIFAEWNGHKHEDIPRTNKWAYLVQYNSASEGWNCTLTDTIIFFSQNYSYKTMVQAAGRIDRLNTPFKDLWYYHLSSHSSIDLAINRALDKKKKFNENKFVGTF